MKTGIARKTFFTKKEYEVIKKKYEIPLNYYFYRKLIKTYNKFLCEEILENENGSLLPLDLGKIRIRKYKPSKEVHTEQSGKKIEYNFHSLGYVYFFTWERGFKYENRNKRNYGIKAKLFTFKAHRMNLKRPLAQIVKQGLQEYITSGTCKNT